MYNAPSVSFPVGRPLFAGLLAGGMWLAGACITAYWWHEALPPGWRHAAAAVAVACAGAWALLGWMRSPAGELAWDGTCWTAPDGAGAGSLQVTLDLQQRLLVRLAAPGRTRWLWLERHRCPPRWSDLRRAVYSRAKPPALPAIHPPAATP